ncbi:SET and MYND domain-containing protein 3 [Actinomortierella ambigua]|nr:SET and MYND domain-containing protein 3 [Actinomortierella ambigua]
MSSVSDTVFPIPLTRRLVILAPAQTVEAVKWIVKHLTSSGKDLFRSPRRRTNRTYRVKKRNDVSSDDSDNEPLSTPTTTEPAVRSHAQVPAYTEAYPLVQSQDAHTLGELYPSLSRLSFLGEPPETSDLATTDPPLSTEIENAPMMTTAAPVALDLKEHTPPIAEYSVPPPALQSVWGKSEKLATTLATNDVLFEVRDTGSKGFGLYYVSPTNEPLKPGRLVFRELPLTGVVNDDSLPFVCSSCFRDTRAETEQESSGNGPHDGPGAKPLRSSKLVRCAGCKLVCYCNKNCQLRDWKLHHQLECQGIQQSMKNSLFHEIWTKKPQKGTSSSNPTSQDHGVTTSPPSPSPGSSTKPKLSARMDTTATRALCRLIRRRLRIMASERYKRENGGRADQREKQVQEMYSTTFDQQELEWQDSHGFEWLDRFIRTPAGDIDLQGPSTSSGASESKNLGVENQKRLTRILTLMASCIVPGKEDRFEFFNSLSRQDTAAALMSPEGQLDAGQGGAEELSSSPSSGAAQLARKLAGYGFTITNQETTKGIGLGLYAEQMAFMNHSCVPNCIYTFQGARVECRVIRPVMPGEELTISYVDQIGTTRERQQQLKERYYFDCNCPLCLFYPANPLVSSDASPLESVAPNYVAATKGSQSSTRYWETKQGFLCGTVGRHHPPSTHGKGRARSHARQVFLHGEEEAKDLSPIVTTEAHLEIYNTVNVACPDCQEIDSQGDKKPATPTAHLDLEKKQENEERFEQQLAQFRREMKQLRQGPFSETMGNSRSFELWKAKNATDVRDRKRAGIDTRLGILPIGPRRAYEDCLKTLRNDDGGDDDDDNDNGRKKTAIRRSFAHHLVRRFHQEAFDELVASKQWVGALQESLALERILATAYVDGLHPLRAIQALYTCKIANLLANLLLEESTIEVEDGDAIEFVDYHEEEDAQDVAFVERELAKQRAEKQKVEEQERQKQWMEAREHQMANAEKAMEVEAQAAEDERVITVPLQRASAAEASVLAPGASPASSLSSPLPPKALTKRQARDKTLEQVLKMLKTVEPLVEETSLQQLFKICWGVDGRIPRMYRDEVESFKQALHYAGLPVVVA